MDLDERTFTLLLDRIDSIKVDLKEDIALVRKEVEKVDAKVQANSQFKWKLSGVALAFTIIFQGILAYIQSKFNINSQ